MRCRNANVRAFSRSPFGPDAPGKAFTNACDTTGCSPYIANSC